MKQELRFGLDLGQLAVLKKKGLGRLSAAFEGGFFIVYYLNFLRCSADIS